MFTLYIGDKNNGFAKSEKKLKLGAYLIDHENWNQDHIGVAYTSLADLPGLDELAFLFRQADVIVYNPPIGQWSDGKNSKQKEWTEYYLTVFSFVDSKKILNWNIVKDINDVTLKLEDTRKTESKQLWFAGCSITHGEGLTDLNQRYSNILSKKLNLPMSSLSKSASSIFWASDQILKSDIRPNDILIWGLTSVNRITYYNEETKETYYICANDYKKYSKEIPHLSHTVPEKFFVDFNLTFRSINQILQVVEFCKTNNIKLILVGLLTGIEMASYLTTLPEYLHLEGLFGVGDTRYIDFGTDGEHPGPKMHEWYAEQILNRLVK